MQKKLIGVHSQSCHLVPLKVLAWHFCHAVCRYTSKQLITQFIHGWQATWFWQNPIKIWWMENSSNSIEIHYLVISWKTVITEYKRYIILSHMKVDFTCVAIIYLYYVDTLMWGYNMLLDKVWVMGLYSYKHECNLKVSKIQ